MRTTLALLCDSANVSTDRKLNILGIFSNITAKRFPATHPSVCIVLKVSGDAIEAGGHNLTARLLDQDGVDVLPSLSVPVKIPADGGEFTVITTVTNMAFKEPGDFCFEIIHAGESVASLPLKVKSSAKPKNGQKS